MGGFNLRAVCGPIVLACAVGACGSAGMDLARNDKLYRATTFRVRVPADRTVCILPVVDERTAAVVEASGPYAVKMMSRTMWKRSLPEMLGEILERDVRSSKVFANVTERVQPDGCLLRVAIKDFDAGLEEHPTGRRSFARVRLHMQVHGPEGPGRKRPLWLDRDFGDVQATDIGMQPAGTPILLGRSLMATDAQILAAIDQSNVARAGVPLDLGK